MASIDISYKNCTFGLVWFYALRLFIFEVVRLFAVDTIFICCLSRLSHPDSRWDDFFIGCQFK